MSRRFEVIFNGSNYGSSSVARSPKSAVKLWVEEAPVYIDNLLSSPDVTVVEKKGYGENEEVIRTTKFTIGLSLVEHL